MSLWSGTTRARNINRRVYITEQFGPALDYLNGAAPAPEAFFPKGSDHDAYVHIRDILRTATGDLLIIDGYMDGSIYQVLGGLAASGSTLRVDC